MSNVSEIETREAAHGERMIEVKLRFWTDTLAEKGSVIPKHAWSAGVVRMERNNSHGIVPGAPKPFNSLLDIGAVIEKTLLEQGVVLHPSQRMRKYFSDAPKKAKAKPV
jgi:hypothetical protein